MATNGTSPNGAVLAHTAPEDAKPIVELRGVGKSYGNIHALYGVSLAVRPGQVTYMVGDHFSVLRLGTMELSADRNEVSLEELTNHMAGGIELASLKHELAQVRGVDVEELPEVGNLQAPVAAFFEGTS